MVFKKVLELVISDFYKLKREGIIVFKFNGVYYFFGIVSVIIVDNLDVYSILGFMELFIILRNCMFCFIIKEEMWEKNDCENFNMWMIEMYFE